VPPRKKVRGAGLRQPLFSTLTSRSRSSASALRPVQPSRSGPSVSMTWRPLKPRLQPTDPSRNNRRGPEDLCPGVEAPPWLAAGQASPSGPPLIRDACVAGFLAAARSPKTKPGLGGPDWNRGAGPTPCPQMGRREYPKPSASATAPSCHAAKSPAVNMASRLAPLPRLALSRWRSSFARTFSGLSRCRPAEPHGSATEVLLKLHPSECRGQDCFA
jgi:hypothetical protein